MVEATESSITTTTRCKLGLALSGGGFRASLFHLGVLRRMAELDLLRYVEVLSTVSGGSITGALYVLLLKKHMDAKYPLEKKDYKQIIDELDAALIKGIKQNLRTRLFRNPLGLLRVLLTNDSLGRRMGRIYERYIFQDIVKELNKTCEKPLKEPGRFRLKDLLIKPGGEAVKGGIEDFNKSVVDNRDKKKGSVITKIIINATTLNSGVPFWFTPVEIGDSRLGFVRFDEVEEIESRKALLEMTKNEIDRLIEQLSNDPHNFKQSRVPSLTRWWKKQQQGIVNQLPTNKLGPQLGAISFPDTALKLGNAPFGLLRTMKLAAWYIRTGIALKIKGGLSADEHMERLWEAFSDIDKSLAEECQAMSSNQLFLDELLDLVLDIYYLRSAEVLSKSIRNNCNKLTVGEAVGASACFPPVFPPFLMLGIYDDMYVTRLGLTDGGVYDNIGLTALLDERCTHIIASDTSGLFDVQQKSAAGRLKMGGRIASILMDDVATLQRHGLRVRRRFTSVLASSGSLPPAIAAVKRTTGLDGLAFFHINSPDIDRASSGSPGRDGLIAALRTDLDGFGDIEIAALVNRGYNVADQYIRTYFADTCYADPNIRNFEYKEPKSIEHVPPEKIDKVLEVGKYRIFRSLMLQPIWLICPAIILGIAIWAAYRWNLQISLTEAKQWVQFWFEKTPPFIKRGWAEETVAIGPVLLSLVIAVIIYVGAKALPIQKFQYRHHRKLRTIFAVGKWMRTLLPKWLWLLGYGSLIIALAVSVVATLSHYCFYKPFEWLTRIPPKEEER